MVRRTTGLVLDRACFKAQKAALIAWTAFLFVLMTLSRTARSAAASGGRRSLTRSSTRTTSIQAIKAATRSAYRSRSPLVLTAGRRYLSHPAEAKNVRRRHQRPHPDIRAAVARGALEIGRAGAGADRCRRHRARPADPLARRRRIDLDRDDARAAGALAGERAGLAALGRRQPRHHRRQRLPDAGGHRVRRKFLRRSDRGRSRARALSR